MSHIGVARDLAAVLNHNNIKCQLNFADISAFKEGSEKPLSIEIKDEKSCPRYAGISIKNIKVKAHQLGYKKTSIYWINSNK